jgi:hypothetical protein
VCTELLDEAGRVAATGEFLYLHVETDRGAVTAMPPDRQAAVSTLLAAHAHLPRPDYLGRGITAHRPRSGSGSQAGSQATA